MTADVIALCESEPGAASILEALNAASAGLQVRPAGHAGLIQLYDDDGRALVTIEGPLLVRVSGEAGRLLGPAARAPHPVWWVEARAAGRAGDAGRAGGPAGDAGPDGHASGRPGGREIARRFADALVEATGGCTWPSR